MIPTLDAIHEWDGAIDLNTPLTSGAIPGTGTPFGGTGFGGYPRFYIARIPGLRSLPDSQITEGVAHPGQIGERFDPLVLDGKSVVYEGQVEALSESELGEALDQLVAAFSDRRTAKVMRIAPGEDRERFYRAVPISFDCDEEWSQDLGRVPSVYVRAFTLGLRLPDPRFYYPDLETESDTYSAGEARVSCENEGSAPTDPVITVYGPATTITLATSGGRQLVIPVALAGGTPETLTVDFAARTIEHSSLGDVAGLLDEEQSNWWDRGVYGLDPLATSDVVLTGTGMDAGTELEVEWRSADWS